MCHLQRGSVTWFVFHSWQVLYISIREVLFLMCDCDDEATSSPSLWVLCVVPQLGQIAPSSIWCFNCFSSQFQKTPLTLTVIGENVIVVGNALMLRQVCYFYICSLEMSIIFDISMLNEEIFIKCQGIVRESWSGVAQLGQIFWCKSKCWGKLHALCEFASKNMSKCNWSSCNAKEARDDSIKDSINWHIFLF